MAEDAGAADLISGGRLQLGISRGSPEQVIDGLALLRLRPRRGRDRRRHGAARHAEAFLEVLEGEGFAQPNPRPMFPNPPGLLRVEPHSEGLRDRIWWGSGSNATAVWAAKLGMNLQSSTLKDDETGEPLPRPAGQADRGSTAHAWKEAGHEREPRVSVSRSIFALTDERDWPYFGRDRNSARPGRHHRREDAGDLRPLATPPSPDELVEAAPGGRGDRRRRHPAAHGPEPARRRLQRPRHRVHPDPRRPGPRLALTPWPHARHAADPGRHVTLGAAAQAAS